MSEPSYRFLTNAHVLKIHDKQLELKGGEQGIVKAEYLDSAVNAPRATFGGCFLHCDVFEMAAAYLRSLALNHAFVDGNKRTAVGIALVFLELNGQYLDEIHQDALTELVLEVACGVADKEVVADFFRTNCRSIR